MEKGLPKERAIIDFELLHHDNNRRFYHHLMIYFVLEGSLRVKLENTETVLGEKEFFFVNPFQYHTLKAAENTLAIEFRVDQNKLSLYYDVSQLQFKGNSAEEDPEQCQAFRTLLENCLVYYYGKKTGDGRTLLKLNILYYQMADRIITSFTVAKNARMGKAEDDSNESRIQAMISYVQTNYQKPLKLEDLADRFYLSPSYISRYFKRMAGVNFVKYLIEIRLEAARWEMMNTEKPLTRIAMDCGFPDLSAFNKSFKKKYEMNPKDYRKKQGQSMETQEDIESEAGLEYRLLDYLDQNNSQMEDDYDLMEAVEADTGSFHYLKKTWNRLINIGRIAMLLHTSTQNHLLFLQEELGFEYVRVWDLYDPELRIHAESEDKKYNFSRLDTALDFLVAHQLKPYLELGFKPNILLDAKENYTHYEERELFFKKGEDFGNFIKSMFVHLVNRYSIQKVSSWCFEMWCDPRVFPNGDPTLYFEYYDQAYQAIKAIAPLTKLGGDYDRTYRIIDFETLVQRWSLRNIQPDFLSIYCYPIIKTESEKEKNKIYDLEDFSLYRYLMQQKDILMKYGMNLPIYISEWNFTMINFNVLNDSCFKGAWIMQTLMELYPHVDTMGYWFGSDIFADGDETPMLLNGRCGLVTHQNICKPAFWAFKFMNRLEDCLLSQTKHAMVTMDEFDNFVIACHNCKPLDISYYMQEEKNITIQSMPVFYSDRKKLVLKIKITGMKNGLYHIKSRFVNSEYGSVQDEWMRMGRVAFLNSRDVDYIDHMSRPRITISEHPVTDGTMYLTVKLEPQEIQCIHLFRYVEEND